MHWERMLRGSAREGALPLKVLLVKEVASFAGEVSKYEPLYEKLGVSGVVFPN